MGRRWGKTVLGGVISLATASQGGRVAWIVPTYKNGRPLWRWAESAVAELRKARKVEVNRSDQVISFDGGGFLGLYSADNPDSIRGEWFHVAILDEAARIVEDVWTDAIQPTLADQNGDAILISTPKGHNWFWQEWVRGQALTDDIASWTAPTCDNPNPFIQRAAELASDPNRLPERTYRQEWLAEFIPDGGGVFRRVTDCIVDTTSAWSAYKTYVMGVDWAKSHDWTVLTVMDADSGQVVAWDRFNQVDWAVQRQRLTALSNEWRVTSILAERNSIGDPNIEALQREGLPVYGFTTTNATKAQIVEGLALALETRSISLPNNAQLISELQAFEMERLPSGMVRYNAASGMHDDSVISLALANHARGNMAGPLSGDAVSLLAGFRGV